MKLSCTFIGILLMINVKAVVCTYAPTDSISVYIFLSDQCVISQNYTLTLNTLHKAYANENLEFVGIFPNLASKPDKIDAFKEKYKIPFQLKTDYFKTLTRELGAKVTPEVVVYNHTRSTILYKGRIDNMYARVGKKRTIVTTSELEDVLTAIQQNQPIPIKETDAVGCIINFQDGL